MSTVERKEYQETKISRTLSPGRTQKTSQFDANLDHLLEDLQNSVSRPGSSLGNATTTYKESYRQANGIDGLKSNSLSRVSHVKSANPVTEYSSDDAYTYTSPDGREKVHEYKKEKYMYGYTSSDTDIAPERSRMQSSINQLDSLLDDLQQVKKSSYSEKETSYNSAGVEPITQSSTVRSVNRELKYGDTPRASSKTRTLERMENKREYQYSGSEGTYGDIKPLRTTSPSPSSRTSTLTKQAKVTNVHEYPVKVVETTAPEIDPEVLAHLDPNLHPPGNTKVTTTIKTYTYEIPGSGSYPTDLHDTSMSTLEREKYTYSPDTSITTPSKSFTYAKMENKENMQVYRQPVEPVWQDVKIKKRIEEHVTDSYDYQPPYQKPPPPGGMVVKETVTTRNYQPGYSPELEPPSSHQTYVYNEKMTTREADTVVYPPPVQPKREETYIIDKETTNIREKREPPFSERGYPVGNPPASDYPSKTTYIHKETHTNYQNGHPRGKSPPRDVNIHYTYKSTNTSENRYRGDYPDESKPLLPQKFPTNDGEGPPKKLDDLMATIGNEPPTSPLNVGFTQHEIELQHQKKAELLKQQQEDAEQKKEPPAQAQKTKNVSGPPVYYPPGHEMFASKEESAAWRAEGGYGKASGKYMYEAESKSKSKSSKGATVVPVCLPLCCGLPCTLI